MNRSSRMIRIAAVAAVALAGFGLPRIAVADGAPYQLYRGSDGSLLCGGKCLGSGFVCCNIVPQ